ncbi:type I DNA topoisomerase [Candidatus Azambacteria bacterium]|nr:type I DNA topoisomerase [Candidatus Azambacteria bacterium]
MKLIIVESPTKARTISQFLGKDFQVESSFGHVRDLPKNKLGIDVENNFEPSYVVPVAAKKKVADLKKCLNKKIETVILATDGDREGEAIAWHLAQVLGLKNPQSPIPNSKPQNKNLKSKILNLKSPVVERIVFHEITKEAIEEALKNPRQIDLNLVNAQQARRILDRLVGYKLSPFLCQKITKHLSAGRVQSVALRLIVDREEEIRKFQPEEYWSVVVSLLQIKNQKSKIKNIEASLFKINNETITKLGIKTKKQADQVSADLRSCSFKVVKIDKKESKRNPLPPFTTSTLQQEASHQFHFSAKQTIRLAQNLYENGLITYMRTDSVNLSRDSVISAKRWLEKNLGKNYTLSTPRFFQTKSKLAQEAHEAIRPTKCDLITEKLNFPGSETKLYDLIWRRFTASQMPQAIFTTMRVEIEGRSDKNNYLLVANGQSLVFDGFLKIWKSQFQETELPILKKDEILELDKITVDQHFTLPPARYNEASLIKALEDQGIGRPSTYASIISVIQLRNYVEKNKGRYFESTKIGKLVTDVLVKNFPEIVEIDFTAKMEDEFDNIASGQRDWREIIKDFYLPFEINLKQGYTEMEKIDLDEKTDKTCDKCDQPMIIKFGRFGRFLACSGFPKCKNAQNLMAATPVGVKCPRSGQAMVEKKSKRGRVFYGCSGYPDCNFALWDKPLNEICPQCESLLVIFGKTEKVKCSRKDCDYKRYGPVKDEL